MLFPSLKLRNDNERQRVRKVVLISTLGFIPPEHNHAIILIGPGSHDDRNNNGEEVIAGSNCGLVARIENSIIDEPIRQSRVHLIVLVRSNEVISGDIVILQIFEQLLQWRVVLGRLVLSIRNIATIGVREGGP